MSVIFKRSVVFNISVFLKGVWFINMLKGVWFINMSVIFKRSVVY